MELFDWIVAWKWDWFCDQTCKYMLAALGEIFLKFAKICTFYQGVLIFPIGGNVILQICCQKG